ncbi:MAG: porin [Planctomycetaceae bacterium]|nr:MAG: porin [Planctomycetaceae bacterium]
MFQVLSLNEISQCFYGPNIILAIALAIVLQTLGGHARGWADEDLPPLPAHPVDSTDDVDDHAELTVLRQRLENLEHLFSKQQQEAEKKQASAAKKPTVNWTGQLQLDTYFIDQDEINKMTYGDAKNGMAFRRARFGMFGEHGPTQYRLEFDFAQSGRPTFLDVWGAYTGLPGIDSIKFGHFFEPFSMERQTSNRFQTFMERSSMDQAFSPVRNSGVAIQKVFEDEAGTFNTGIFRSDSDVFGDDTGDNFEWAWTSRLTWLPWYDDTTGDDYLHLGTGYSLRGANAEQARFRAQPESREGTTIPNIPFFVDTGAIPSSYYQMLNGELAWCRGPFLLHGEWTLTVVDRIDRPAVLLHGGFVNFSYLLTGEHRPYRKQAATFDRVIPLRDALKKSASARDVEWGPGAWEIAFRWSYLDLSDDTVLGGELTDLTFGLNWYLTPYTRMTTNYVHAIADHPVTGRSHANIFGIRWGYEF